MKNALLARVAFAGLLAGAAGLAGCTQPADKLTNSLPPTTQGQRNKTDDPTKDPAEKAGAYAGGKGNTFDHNQDLGAYGGEDPFDILQERENEGPPDVRTRMHSCQKVEYQMLGGILTSLGVDMSKTGNPPTAADLYKSGGGALGISDYDSRVSEATWWTTAGAAKMFDIFVQAAPEIIAAFPTLQVCQTADGTQPKLFDGNNHCIADGLSCLMGKPARQAHVDICNQAIIQATDVDTGKAIAVATVLSAAHSCE